MTNIISLFEDTNITLPQRVQFEGQSDEADICIRFLRHLSLVPSSRLDIKILSSIQFVADTMDYNDAHVSKILIDNGLRAPRSAFPAAFLNFIDVSFTRDALAINSSYNDLRDLALYWQQHGESVFYVAERDYAQQQYHFASV